MAEMASGGATIAPSANAAARGRPGMTPTLTTATTAVVNRTRPTDRSAIGLRYRLKSPTGVSHAAPNSSGGRNTVSTSSGCDLDMVEGRHQGQCQTGYHQQHRPGHVESAGDAHDHPDHDHQHQDEDETGHPPMVGDRPVDVWVGAGVGTLRRMTQEQDGRERWALVLGASSGFGGAVSKGWARAGFNIVGVHLDLRGTIAIADAVRDAIATTGVQVVFHNVNAADDEKRTAVVAAISALFAGASGRRRRALRRRLPALTGVRHHPAATSPIEEGGRELSRKQLEMTADVMAHSLLYWVRDLFHAGLFGHGSRLYAMTSEGATLAVPTYGAVSVAKAALEAHVRQLALELMPHGITVNAIRAGVTDTPALHRIPNWEHLLAEAQHRNPSGRVDAARGRRGRARGTRVAAHPLDDRQRHWVSTVAR